MSEEADVYQRTFGVNKKANKDLEGMGRSQLIPRRRHEFAMERHTRRKKVNFNMRERVDEFIKQHGLKLAITNENHHWQITQPDQDWQVDWWPSSAKLVVDKRWKYGVHCHDVEQFITAMTKWLAGETFKHNFLKAKKR